MEPNSEFCPCESLRSMLQKSELEPRCSPFSAERTGDSNCHSCYRRYPSSASFGRRKRREWAYIFFSAYLLRLFLLRSHGRFIEKRRSYSTSLRARKKMNRHNVIKSAAGVPHRFASSICDFGSSVVSSPGGQRRHDRHSRCAKRFPY
jgi:hypothetical protein